MRTNNEIKVVLVDDDNDFLYTLSFFLKRIGLLYINTATSYDEGIKLIDSISPDLVLLDINLNEQHTGIDIGVYVRNNHKHCKVIYLTNNFTEDVFEKAKKSDPDAFLDKELDDLKIRQAIELALLHVKHSIEQEDLISYPIYNNTDNFFFVKIGSLFKKLHFEEIYYVFYADRYANLQLEQKVIPISVSMRDFVERIGSKDFFQIHQSYIVNLTKINQISLSTHQVEVNGRWLPIGIRFRKAFQERILLLS